MKRISLLPSCLGLLTAMAILAWPARPRWVIDSHPRRSMPVGESADGHSLFVIEQPNSHKTESLFVRRRVDDGAEEHRFWINTLPNHRSPQPWLSGDRRRLVLVYSHVGTEEMRFGPLENKVVIVDLASGIVLHGPSVIKEYCKEISRDGRFMIVSNRSRGRSSDVIDTRDGKVVLHFEGDPACCFSPDGSAFAVYLEDKVNGGLVIYDLATRAEKKAYPWQWPNAANPFLLRWEGDSLIFTMHYESTEEKERGLAAFAMPLLPDRLGEPTQMAWREWAEQRSDTGRIEISERRRRGGLVRHTHSQSLPPKITPWWIDALQNFDQWLGTEWSGMHPTRNQIECLPGPAHQVTFRKILHGQECYVSEDVHWVAMTSAKGSLEMWNAAPPPRWPIACGTGALVGLFVVGFQHWRRTRKAVRPISSSVASDSNPGIQ